MERYIIERRERDAHAVVKNMQVRSYSFADLEQAFDFVLWVEDSDEMTATTFHEFVSTMSLLAYVREHYERLVAEVKNEMMLDADLEVYKAF